MPILLTPQRRAAQPKLKSFLREFNITHVVMMGGTVALSEEVENAIRGLGITDIDRIAGQTRYETSTLFARYATEKFRAACFDGGQVGLARGDVPFDSLSSSPLLAPLCPALVLTESKSVPDPTAKFLDDARRLAHPGSVTVSVFGGDAAVSQRALNTYLGIETPDE